MSEKEVVYPELVSVKDAAKMLACSTATVRRMIKDGIIGHIKRKGGHRRGERYRIPISEIDNYIKNNLKMGEPISEKYSEWEKENAR